MSKTPNRFPGQLEAESGVLVYSGSTRPTQDGEIRYITGEGFLFRDAGVDKALLATASLQHDSLQGVQGGIPGQHYHMTSDQYDAVSTFSWADKRASYVVVAGTSSLSNERVLAAGVGVTINDFGANNNITVDVNDNVVATLSGSTFHGTVNFSAGLSGSLTRLSDGTPYIIGQGTTFVTTGSGGQLYISSSSDPVTWATVSSVLGTQAGANVGYVFKSDGAGAGTMTKNTQNIPNMLTVGQSGDVDYTSIKSAVQYAIDNGASFTTPWRIRIFPGTYTEQPITVIDGINIDTGHTGRVNNVFVVAADPDEDLFTCTGGSVSGIVASGVTNATKCLFRCATAGTLTSLFGIRVQGCSTGIVVSGGATVFMTHFSIIIESAADAVTTGITVTGAGSYIGIEGGAIAVYPAAIIAMMANPLQTCFEFEDSSLGSIVGLSLTIPHFDNTQVAVSVNSSAHLHLFSSEIRYSATAVKLGNLGSSVVAMESLLLYNNDLDVSMQSATSKAYGNITSTGFTLSQVAGSTFSATVSDESRDSTALNGNAEFAFDQTHRVNFRDYYVDFTSTGVCDDGLVTELSGTTINYADGDAWSVREDPYDDVNWFSWTTGSLTLPSDGTYYVYYDASVGVITSSVSTPADEDPLLGTVVTLSGSIRYIHDTRTVTNDIARRLHQFLLDTHHSTFKSGLTTTQGTATGSIKVNDGYYYLGLTECHFSASVGDSTWTYFYGSNGNMEITGSTLIDSGSYDLNGVLTPLSSGYYRSDTVFVTSDSRISVVYGATQYASSSLAEAASVGTPPNFVYPSSFAIARVVVLSGSGITQIVDTRTTTGGGIIGGGGGVSLHSSLLGLDADDHLQYFLTSGGRMMTGDLNMGGNDVNNVGTVDGVDVSSHASRHAFGSVDSLSVGVPLPILIGQTAASGSGPDYALYDHVHAVSSSNPQPVGDLDAEGVAQTPSRSDHVHSHGTHSDQFNHALANASAHGFMPSSYYIKVSGSHTTVEHPALRQLIHFIDDGPAEGFTTGAYREKLPVNSPFPSSVTWYTASDKLHKIVEKTIVRNDQQRPTTVTWRMYNSDDTVAVTVADTFDYSGGIWTPTKTRSIT